MEHVDSIVGKIFESTKSGKFEVIGFYDKVDHHKRFKVKFLQTGTEVIAYRSNITRGLVYDNFYPRVYGKGYLGNLTQMTSKRTTHPDIEPVYDRWYAMLSRVYNEAHTHYNAYGGKGITVSERWLNFTNFYFDVQELPNFNFKGVVSGQLELDKDTKVRGNTVYSGDTCIWLNKQDNHRHMTSKSREFVAVSPEGKKYEGFSVRSFAEEHGLKRSTLARALSLGVDRTPSLKGWELYYKQ